MSESNLRWSESAISSRGPGFEFKFMVRGMNQESERWFPNFEDYVLTGPPKTTFKDILGHTGVKRNMRANLHYFESDMWKKIFPRARPPSPSFLLHGPADSGKTALLDALYGEYYNLPRKVTFLRVPARDLLSPWNNAEAENMAMLVKFAKERRPAIILIDDVELILGNYWDLKGIRSCFNTTVDGFDGVDPYLAFVCTTRNKEDIEYVSLNRFTPIHVGSQSGIDGRLDMLKQVVEPCCKLSPILSRKEARFLYSEPPPKMSKKDTRFLDRETCGWDYRDFGSLGARFEKMLKVVGEEDVDYDRKGKESQSARSYWGSIFCGGGNVDREWLLLKKCIKESKTSD